MEELSKHRTVLLEETIASLQPESGKSYLDGTFGGGGHARRLLELSAPEGKVTGIDRDPLAAGFAESLKDEYPKRFRFETCSYEDVQELDEQYDGIILDLGMSSDQLESFGKGFSFQRVNEALDLRFDNRHGQNAAQFLMQSSPSEIERVFREYAEDRYAKRLAVRIVNERRARQIRTVGDFITYVGTDNPKVLAPLFQALRIEVNDELGVLKRGLVALASVLKVGGVLSVITFHSIEDGIVKRFMKTEQFEVLTKKPISPTDEEVQANPRSRSAKLRSAKKVSG